MTIATLAADGGGVDVLNETTRVWDHDLVFDRVRPDEPLDWNHQHVRILGSTRGNDDEIGGTYRSVEVIATAR